MSSLTSRGNDEHQLPVGGQHHPAPAVDLGGQGSCTVGQAHTDSLEGFSLGTAPRINGWRLLGAVHAVPPHHDVAAAAQTRWAVYHIDAPSVLRSEWEGNGPNRYLFDELPDGHKVELLPCVMSQGLVKCLSLGERGTKDRLVVRSQRLSSLSLDRDSGQTLLEVARYTR
ncbi:MAG: hypothetical protein ABI548_10180 [Polyangiaceae bacterium]